MFTSTLSPLLILLSLAHVQTFTPFITSLPSRILSSTSSTRSFSNSSTQLYQYFDNESDRLRTRSESIYPENIIDLIPSSHKKYKKIISNRLENIRNLKVNNEFDYINKYNAHLSLSTSIILPNFTKKGWSLQRIDEPIIEQLHDFLTAGIAKNETILESELIGNNEIIKGSQPRFLPLSSDFIERILKTLLPYHEQFANTSLLPSRAYGLRVYTPNSVLSMHTDKPERNVIGSIIHLGGDEEWGLVVEDLSGEVHEVFMNPGDAFFYESAKVYHGRIKPFNGSFYCGVFCHYVPEVWGEWDREGHVAIERSWADEGGGEKKGGGWGEEEWIVWSDGEIVKKDYKRAWGDAWEEKFNALLSHKVEFGGCNFPQNVVTEDGVKLGAWVKKQRANKERLSAERIEKLNNAGFVWRKYESAWQANFLKLLDYKKEFGDVLVPERFVTDDGKRLGAWVTKQRFRRERLSGEQREKLEVSGFVWDASAQAGERLKGEEKKKNGGEREETLSRRVGSWDDGTHVHLFRGNRYNDRWLELWEWKYIRLLEFKEEFGHVLVPTDYVTKDGRRLGKWASDQRTMKKNDRLSVERFEKLEGAHFVWDAQEAAWEDMFDKLLKHKEEFGDLFVPKDYVTKDGRRLGNWVGLQRKNKKNDVLSAERVEKLNKIGLVWGVLEAAWEANYLKLVEYTEEFGHALVPRDPPYVTEDGANLGGWVGVQRNNRDIISAERVERLNILNFVWDPHEAAWEENWKKLLEYKEEFGETNPPPSNHPQQNSNTRSPQEMCW
ncbi:hypothetical protein TL16_g10187 [Triparma laevis f. inornata]|uniref:Helicase-associated domain-containing protein n=1 Tax=Triparma laevis f. inornata TaxID=1714386 RepID=A0A9W7EPW1_9STRA|nr:hypothetical protein TL16_g10187 [Triparma laevis f. inornata]